MRPGSGILRFTFWLVLIYGLLAVPWPGVREAYARFYMGAGNRVFGSFGSRGEVKFKPLASPQPGTSDIEVITKLRGDRVEGWSPQSTRLMGYLPTVEVIALILATPIPWRRRWIALVSGVILTHVFIAARILLSLFRWFSSETPWQLFDLSPFWREALVGVHEIVVESPTLSFVVPAFIWIVVTFRRADLETALAKLQGTSNPEQS